MIRKKVLRRNISKFQRTHWLHSNGLHGHVDHSPWRIVPLSAQLWSSGGYWRHLSSAAATTLTSPWGQRWVGASLPLTSEGRAQWAGRWPPPADSLAVRDVRPDVQLHAMTSKTSVELHYCIYTAKSNPWKHQTMCEWNHDSLCVFISHILVEERKYCHNAFMSFSVLTTAAPTRI